MKFLIYAATALSFAASTARAEPPSITTHSIHIHGKELKYTAEAGWMPLTDGKSAEVQGNMFYAAYTVPGNDRPIAFVWNGGPGSPATWVQFQAFGPKLINQTTISDNEDTVLPTADLVFIDPVGTGYSRATKPEYAHTYFTTTGDALSVTQFITLWLKQHRAENRPFFLIGESFGVFRAGGVTERLESQGHHVAGTVLISGGVASGPLIPPDLRTALTVPQRAVAAMALGKSSPELGKNREEVERAAAQWALLTYLPALRLKEKLSDTERDAIVKDLSKYTGYPMDKIDRQKMVIGPDYLEVMSPQPGKRLSQYDMRTTDVSSFDENFVPVYLKTELGISSNLEYWQVPDNPVASQAGQGKEEAADPMRARGNWVNDVRWPEDKAVGRGNAEPWLPKAMEINPKIKVLVAAGQYDSLNSCVENDVLLGMLEPDIARNYTMHCYTGGHMIYRDPPSRTRLSSDIQNFMLNTVNGR